MDHSLSGSFVHGILPARILEWVAISSSRVLLNRYTVSVLQDDMSYGDGWWRWLQNIINAYCTRNCTLRNS